ncbi:MAG: hypothetical protein ABUL63_02820 [Acidobacteriota bacterium]
MKNSIRSTSLLASLVAVTLLAGCGTTGILGGSDDRTTDRSDRNGTYDPYQDRIDNVRGTIESVNTRDRTIVVDREDSGYNNNLRNENNYGDRVVLSYDDRTTVAFQGKTFRPEDLERGDRILAEVASSSSLSNDRLFTDEIQVLYDVSGGVGDSTGGYDNGGYDDPVNRNLRGTVRSIDTRGRTVEIDTSSRGFSSGSTGRTGVVLVHYDTKTVVEFEGRRYQPENLERGDKVEIDVRDVGGQLLAEEIQVLNDARSR